MNTKNIVSKVYKRLWSIKRLKASGASLPDLIDVYMKQIRSILEFAVPVWNSSLRAAEAADIERVQKVFLHIILGNEYMSYESALSFCCLESLAERRTKLLLCHSHIELRLSLWFS